MNSSSIKPELELVHYFIKLLQDLHYLNDYLIKRAYFRMHSTLMIYLDLLNLIKVLSTEID
jgi:hypothetical protein